MKAVQCVDLCGTWRNALRSAGQKHVLLPVRWIVGRLIHVNQPALRFTLQRAIQIGPAFLIDLSPQALLDLKLCARPQPFWCKRRCPLAHPWCDVVATNHPILARIVLQK